MTRVQMTDNSGAWFDKDRAKSWEENTRWDGHNHISVPTGSQWQHEKLYQTASGKWVMHHWSQWQGSGEAYEIITEEKAYRWLMVNGHHTEVPEEVLLKMEV